MQTSMLQFSEPSEMDAHLRVVVCVWLLSGPRPRDCCWHTWCKHESIVYTGNQHLTVVDLHWVKMSRF